MTQTNKYGRGASAKPGAEAHSGSKSAMRSGAKANGEMPGWTNGLRQLYDQVVDEDLPDSFRDLLAKLDDKN